MKEIIDIITNNGIGVVCVGYLIYFQLITMRDLTRTLESINTRLAIIEDNMGPQHKSE